MNNRYFKLKIPFATKSYINKAKKGLIIKGYAFYIFDRNINKFIKEYIQLSKGNFRITDDKMTKPTKYYQTQLVKNFRTKYLDVFSHKLNHSSDIEYFELEDKQIEVLNKEFKNMNSTVLRMFSLLSGSNPSGAETNNKNSPIKYIEGEYFDCNFINPLKKYRDSKINSHQLIYIMSHDLRTYSLSEVMDDKSIIPGFKNEFYNYNQEFRYRDNFDFNNGYYEDVVQEIVEFKKEDNEFKMSEKQELFIAAIYNKTLEDYSCMIENNKKKLKQKLRSFYTSNINSKIKNGEIPFHSTINKFNPKIIENAHIIKFSELINDEKYEDAINPYNCLRIDNNMHCLYDKNDIYFTKNGDVIQSNNNVLKLKNYLDVNNMPNETLKFFNKIAREPI